MRHMVTLVGTILVGRDAYPNETQDIIKEVEKGDKIFIRSPKK